MPDYELRLSITADDDEQARGLAHAWTRTLAPHGLGADQARLVQINLPENTVPAGVVPPHGDLDRPSGTTEGTT